MEWAIEEAASTDRFSVGDISAIHARLMSDAAHITKPGSIRTVQNWIGGNNYNPCGADFVPPPPEYVGDLLVDLCDAINDDLLPPIMQAALVHAQFETIHPFEDGNGRTGRALIHVVLRRRGISRSYVPPISVVIARSKERYVHGLTTFRYNAVDQWIEYFAASTSEAAMLAARYVAQVEQLVDGWRIQLQQTSSPPRTDAAAWSLIEMLPACPTISGAVAVARLNRSRGKTYEAIQTLEDAGILIPLTQGKRNQSWEPAGLLDLIAQMEG
jgi:Fic family protein